MTAQTGKRLEGKVALVTGGSRGIGAAIARRLAEDGADVALTYVSAAGPAQAVADGIRQTGRRALAIAADNGDPDAVRDAVERVAADLGRLDILVNNAGIFIAKPVTEATLEEFQRTMDVNVRAVFVAAQAAARRMGDGGRIVTLGSCLAGVAQRPGVALYAMSKAALVGLTKGMARDLGPRGITVNIVHPGPTDTDMNPADGERADRLRSQMAIPRYGEPEDIASLVTYLAGPEARFVTGAALSADGGITA
ncbi:3-oxoacyl-ACP reductase family protein [Azospirillum thermophilum]|uniref:Oxidoreductase n=1 Tax=Azospirillum thermophilum TaxID=2202148 RepID=A0A2S2CYJ3_9PROT|nr:3-oxoacyl-ACP reductase family protein [Azospirillum thermophilum]AWK89539.1 oxidoreductase [Azospirillum thermophilum]